MLRELSAWNHLEDKYGACIPHDPVQLDVTPCLLLQAAKTTRGSCPGLDGCGVKELGALPLAAWEVTLHVLRSGQRVFNRTIFGLNNCQKSPD